MAGRFRSTTSGIVHPAVPNPTASVMLAVLFQLERSQWQSSRELWDLQRDQLRPLLQFAARSTRFYKERQARDLSALDSDFSRERFSSLPLVTRADLQAHMKSLCPEQLPSGHGEIAQHTTSGSTGEPVRFQSTSISRFFWHAFNFREHLWHAREFGAKMLVVRVEDAPVTLQNWFGDIGTGVLDTGPCVVIPAAWTFDRQLDRICEEQPAYLLGFANNLEGILRTAERRGVQLHWLREVRSLGEAVSDDLRSYVTSQWNLQFTDMYSARETGYLALQCPQSGLYHIQSESSIVEVVRDDGNPCVPGEWGKVVVTPLHNFAFPLIRYDIGDYAEVAGPCRCGRGLPTLRRIHGRSRNLLTLPDGSKRWPTIGTSELLDLAPILRFKLVQKSVSTIEVRLIVERPLTEREIEGLRKHLGGQFGSAFDLRFVFLDEFPTQPGDKFEDFVSDVQ